jgi:LmbE family N-acetylglucosaminyl deacetylase
MNKTLLSLFFLVSFHLNAQTPQALTSSDILVGLKKLDVLGSVLYIAAHPDDENTRLLAYFAKGKLYRTGYLSLTRGDGGQNLIGNEQGVELGLIRTQELLSARRIDGAEQFFSRAFDFGFSKSTNEALTVWGKEKILSDVVWVIRRFHPDIIITRFPQDSRAGHGHHSASAVLAVEAFTAAADPLKFPEQLKYVKPWQAKRILWNTFNFGGANTTSEDQFKIDVGMYNPILGKGYGEIAAESRSQHKSQGFGVSRQRGPAPEYFSVWKGDAPKTDLLDGVDVTWNRVKGGSSIQPQVDNIINSYSLFEPGKSVKLLVELYKNVEALDDDYWKPQKLKEIQQLIEACSALWIEATTTEHLAVQTESLPVTFFLNNRNGNNIILKSIKLQNIDTVINRALESNKNLEFRRYINILDTMPVTQPYWLVNPMSKGSFDVRNQLLIGNADNAAAFNASFSVTIEGRDFEIIRAVKQKITDPVKGEMYQPMVVAPPLLIAADKNLLISSSPDPQTMHFSIRALKDNTTPKFTISDNKQWRVDNSLTLSMPKMEKGTETDVSVVVKPVAKERANGTQTLTGSVIDNNRTYSRSLRSINYDHIPNINYFKVPAVNIVTLDLKIAGKKIGYIEGAGDYVPAALSQMGYEVTLINDNNLAIMNLGQFDAIIAGVRAYNIRESLNANYGRLMRYVEDGGNLIVQYNTSNQIGPVKARIGPYPFDISRNRVTDEKAAMKILKPQHPALNFPNKIGAADFEGWVQERSIYHARNWDSHYETIFSIHDPDEPADEGSLIITKYGKGSFCYTGLVFYRELPAGVPGAYRLMANLIALNKLKAF